MLGFVKAYPPWLSVCSLECVDACEVFVFMSVGKRVLLVEENG